MGFFSGFGLGHLMAPLGGLVSGLLSAGSARQAARYNAARAAEDFERNRSMTMEMYELQRKNNLEFWNMQNAYNHPKMQMARLREAGLNPLLVYGHGSVAGNTAGAIGNPSMSVPESHTPGMSGTRFDVDLGSIFQYSQIKNSDMNTRLQEAQIAKIAADIAYKQKATSLLDRVPASIVSGSSSNSSNSSKGILERIEDWARKHPKAWNGIKISSGILAGLGASSPVFAGARFLRRIAQASRYFRF